MILCDYAKDMYIEYCLLIHIARIVCVPPEQGAIGRDEICQVSPKPGGKKTVSTAQSLQLVLQGTATRVARNDPKSQGI